MNDFFAFRKMMTPALIQILFWIAILASLLGAVALLIGIFAFAAREQTPAAFLLLIPGLLSLVIFPILVRIYCELLIVPFRIHEILLEIRSNRLQV